MIFIILVLGFPLRYCSIGTECLRGFLFRININNKNNALLILKLKIYLYLCFIINTKTNIMKTFKIVKFIFEQEKNQPNQKTYATKQDAVNAGNSWVNDCTVHAEIRRGRAFEVIEINN